MPIKITLRKDRHQSPFRQLLNMLLTSPYGDSAIICSGYIWQPSSGSYKVLDDGLRNIIKRGCRKKGVTTVAGMFRPNYFQNYYRNFITDLRANGVQVSAYTVPRKNWHAKIAIRMCGDKPVAALIGSSNLTGPAYGINRTNWNYEADVLIWIPHNKHNSYFRDDGMDNSKGKIEAILDPDFRQMTEKEQLHEIYNDVMQEELKEFN
jgi:hypothetical protein